MIPASSGGLGGKPTASGVLATRRMFVEDGGTATEDLSAALVVPPEVTAALANTWEAIGERTAYLPAAERPRTAIERRLYGALAALGVEYREQADIGTYTVDAYLPAYRLAVEADGCRWHCCSRCYGDLPDPDGKPAAQVRARQARRDAHLRESHGVAVAHIWQHDIPTDKLARRAVRQVIGPYWAREREREGATA